MFVGSSIAVNSVDGRADEAMRPPGEEMKASADAGDWDRHRMLGSSCETRLGSQLLILGSGGDDGRWPQLEQWVEIWDGGGCHRTLEGYLQALT